METRDRTRHPSSSGADRLKEALQGLGLKSGGTLRERAERLYLTKTLPLTQVGKGGSILLSQFLAAVSHDLPVPDPPLSQLDKKHFAKGIVVPPAPADAPADASVDAGKLEEGAFQVWGVGCGCISLSFDS